MLVFVCLSFSCFSPALREFGFFCLLLSSPKDYCFMMMIIMNRLVVIQANDRGEDRT